MDKFTLYEEGWTYGLIKRLALDFDVEREQVRDAGEVEEQVRFVLICAECSVRRLHSREYFEAGAPNSYRVEFVVDLLPKLRSLNSITGTLWLILAGQCEDCGTVYFVKAVQRRRA